MKFDSLDSNFACARFHQVPSNRILTKLTLRFHSCSLSVHCEFSRIVCVSLFSYQGSLSFDSSFILSLSFSFVKNFFKFFSKLFNDFCDSLLISNSFTLSHSFLNVKYFFEVFYFFKIQNFKRRRRDLNPRAGYPTYTLSRGTSSAS